MDFLDDAHRQDVAIGCAGELVGAVRRTAGDSQRIDLGAKHEIHCLIRIGQELVMTENAARTMTVFSLGFTAFERTKHAEFTFDRNADPMGDGGDPLRDLDIIFV